MQIKLSSRVQAIKPSPTLAVTARAKELSDSGRDIIGLGAGEPDFDTPEHIKQAARDAMDRGDTKYTAVGGTKELKQSVIDKFARENELSYQPGQILVSVGGKHSFYNLAQALLEEGDEVIIPAPYWVSYPDIVLLTGAKPVTVFAGQEQNFKINAQQLEDALNDRSKVVVLNSPSNPTGSVYSHKELASLAEVLLDHPQVWVVSDDIYEHIYWGAEPFANILNVCPELYERTLVLNGASKAYAMTGWRIGYAAGHEQVISAMTKIQSQSTSNPCSISQAAVRVALDSGISCIAPMLEAFRNRHDYLVAALNKVQGFSCNASEGAFYSFPKVEEAMRKLGIDDDVAFAEYVLEEIGLAMVPGSAFGAPGYLRISFATSMEALVESVSRLTKLFGER